MHNMTQFRVKVFLGGFYCFIFSRKSSIKEVCSVHPGQPVLLVSKLFTPVLTSDQELCNNSRLLTYEDHLSHVENIWIICFFSG